MEPSRAQQRCPLLSTDVPEASTHQKKKSNTGAGSRRKFESAFRLHASSIFLVDVADVGWHDSLCSATRTARLSHELSNNYVNVGQDARSPWQGQAQLPPRQLPGLILPGRSPRRQRLAALCLLHGTGTEQPILHVLPAWQMCKRILPASMTLVGSHGPLCNHSSDPPVFPIRVGQPELPHALAGYHFHHLSHHNDVVSHLHQPPLRCLMQRPAPQHAQHAVPADQWRPAARRAGCHPCKALERALCVSPCKVMSDCRAGRIPRQNMDVELSARRNGVKSPARRQHVECD